MAGKLLDIMEFQNRAETGEVIEKSMKFDVKWSRILRKAAEKHNVKYTPHSTVIDDATADGVFEAAVELLSECGIYHNGTFRVISLSEQEIRDTGPLTSKRMQNRYRLAVVINIKPMATPIFRSETPRMP